MLSLDFENRFNLPWSIQHKSWCSTKLKSLLMRFYTIWSISRLWLWTRETQFDCLVLSTTQVKLLLWELKFKMPLRSFFISRERIFCRCRLGGGSTHWHGRKWNTLGFGKDRFSTSRRHKNTHTQIHVHKYMYTKILYTNTCTQIHVHKYTFTNTSVYSPVKFVSGPN